MANNYSKILELSNKNNMGLSNTIKRDYGIPLDYSSVQETYEKAVIYAATDTLAYVGQPISVGGKLYIIDSVAADEKFSASDSKVYDNFLKEVGSATEGDNASIVLENGILSLCGFKTAEHARLPQVKVVTDNSGKELSRVLEWVPIDTIVQGDGNTKTVVAAADGSSISVTSSYNKDTDTYTYTLDATLPAIPDYSVTKEASDDKVTYKLTKDGTPVGEAIVVPNAYDDTDLADRLSTAEGDINDIKKAIAGGVHFVGEAKELPSTADIILLANGIETSYTAIAGDVVIVGDKEFIYTGTSWVELGDLSRVGVLETWRSTLTNLDEAEAGKFVTQVKQTDGKIEVIKSSVTANNVAYNDSTVSDAISAIEQDYLYIGTDNKIYAGKNNVIELIFDGGNASS